MISFLPNFLGGDLTRTIVPIITPATMHLEGALADLAAGTGFIMISGYSPDKEK